MKINTLSTLALTAVFVVSIFIISSISDFGTTSAYAFSNGSPGGRANSIGDNSNCTACHSGTINSGSATSGITSDIPASGYVPGQTYTITMSVGALTINKFGFEVTAEDVANTKVGTFIITDFPRTKFVNSNKAVSHKLSGTTNATTWSCNWTAPLAGSGDITFYAAFITANNNGSTAGDFTYSKTLTVVENLATGVDELVPEIGLTIYPNPTTNYFSINFDGPIDCVSVYSAKGQKVIDAKAVNKVNLEQLSLGTYYVQIQSENNTFTKKIIKK